MSDAITPNPYAAPSSDLQQSPQGHAPSIEEALARGYDFSIGELLNESWSKVKGTKGIIIGGFLVFYVVLLAATFILGGVVGIFGALSDSIALMFIGEILISLLASALAYPFMAGINMVGIRRAADQPLNFNEIFSHFGRTVPLIITAVVMMLLIYLSPWQALEASRKAITQHWFKVFGLFIVLGLIIIVSAIPLGIGLVWSIPLMVVAMGVLYRTIFGVLPAARPGWCRAPWHSPSTWPFVA